VTMKPKGVAAGATSEVWTTAIYIQLGKII
jgi:hypothetical protein